MSSRRGGRRLTTPAEIQTLFGRVPPAYDRLNRLLSLGRHAFWRQAAARLAEPRLEGPLLDLACGTLDQTLALARRFPKRTIVGADFSLEMIRAGRSKLGGGQTEIHPLGADGLHLPFGPASFAGATIAFGIRNMPDHPAGLAELHRVLKPGGRLVILELGLPSGLLARPYLVYLKRFVPLAGRLLAPEPWAYQYLARSIIDFPKPAAFLALMGAAGFRARVLPLNNGIAWLFVGDKEQADGQNLGGKNRP
ncbi:MAG: ubiquinone/menaquinone biosynthesis methyltransferase [Deltaproteobacteria bacterium]|nr:ubiquinone/menaquinone biosynthesis methyltransferase [Deltaproteobacteria bacterium]